MVFLRENVHLIPKGGAVLCLAEQPGSADFLREQGFQVTALEVSDRLAFHDFGRQRWDGIVSIHAGLPRRIRLPVHRAWLEGLKVGGIILVEDRMREVTRGDLLEELSGLHVTRATEGGSMVQLIARRPA
jgi:hypothetical protein